MKKKLSISVLIAVFFVFVTVMTVFAGATFDFGTLAPKVSGGERPAEGEANWTAWWLIYPAGTDQAGTPYEILTEDNTNADDGQDIGYSSFFDPDTVNWVLQIENFLYDPDISNPPFQAADPIYMMFGGLGSYSGSLWEYTINEWVITESSTNHGEVSGPISGAACPTLFEDPIDVSGNTTYEFYGAPGAYHVYRSQNASGAGNGASNGQYFWIDTVTTDIYGYGTFIDNTTEQSWYIVIQADPDSNAIIGCHSEPPSPTSVTIFGFEAVYNPLTKAVDLEWQTSNEQDILGYNVLRSTSETGEKTQINPDLIPPNPGGTGGTYQYADTTVEKGNTYYYWIEYVDTGGSRDSVGSRIVLIWFDYFVPLFNH